MANDNLQCAICLYRGFNRAALTITSGYAVCLEHAKHIQTGDRYLEGVWTPRPSPRPGGDRRWPN